MRLPTIFLCLLLLLSLLPLAHANWGEFVQVRVLDAKTRPLPGASVNITWQISKGHMGVTATKLTGAAGRVNFSIDNYEYFEKEVDPYFTVYVRYGTLSRFTRFLNNRGEMPRTFILPVYRVTLQTTDNSGQPISVNLDIDGQYKVKSDSDGLALVPLPSGRHTVYILFRDSRQNSSIMVSDDVTIPLRLQLYQLNVQVLDDLGTPLDAQVYAGSDVLNTDQSGYVHFYNVTDSRLLLTVHYGQYKKELAVDLSSLGRAAVIFDLHKPSISNLQSVFNGTSLQVRANVADNGDYASGLAEGESSVQLVYSFGSSPSTQSVPMYAAGYNLFEAYINLPEGMREVHYTVEASDAEGNLASSSDAFVAAVQKPVVPPTPSTPSTASKSWVEENSWVLAIFVILLLIGLAYWYYLSRKPPSAANGNTTYTYGKKENPPAPAKPLPIKKTEQAESSASSNQAGLPSPAMPPAPPIPPSGPSGQSSGSPSKPSWAPPWAKMPGTSNKPDNAPPWAGRFAATKTRSAPPPSDSPPASSMPPVGPSMAPMPPPPSMPPMPPPSPPSSDAPTDSSNPAFGLPGKPKPPPSA